MRPVPGTPFANLAPNNPAWFIPGDKGTKGANPTLKYMVLRPRPGDNYYNPQDLARSFPPPEDPGGDVKNLPGVRGYNSQNGQLDTNDSYWIDLAYPVQVTANGKKFKPLFAFLVMDLDRMLNLNVHGNIAAGQRGSEAHVSSQGLGRAHEVNLSKLFTNPAEYRQLFQGALQPGSPPVFVAGRFGDDAAPNPPNPLVNVPGRRPHALHEQQPCAAAAHVVRPVPDEARLGRRGQLGRGQQAGHDPVPVPASERRVPDLHRRLRQPVAEHVAEPAGEQPVPVQPAAVVPARRPQAVRA